MYQRALKGKEKALGPNHTTTLNTVNSLGLLYAGQGRLKEAEEVYQRILKGYKKVLGSDHTTALNTVYSSSVIQLVETPASPQHVKDITT